MRNVPKTAKRSETAKRLVSVLHGEALTPPPIWLMRQAGRYLPEYRAVREQAGSFLELCYHPALAAEVTLQPIRRFGFDAAILFSDILVVPDALGQRVQFLEGEGPALEPITSVRDLARLDPTRTRGKVFLRVRDGRARAPGFAAGDGAHRILRRPVDGRDLHGRRQGIPRPGRCAAVGLSRAAGLQQPHRHRDGNLDRLSRRPGAGRCRRAADLRQLGRLPSRPGVRALGGGADAGES